MDARQLFGRWLDLTPLKSRTHGLVRCRFHGEDRHPSLSVDLERGLFHCFTCHAAGGLREFCRLVGEDVPIRRQVTETLAGGPMARAFDRARREGAWAEQWAPIMRSSDLVRRSRRLADRARALATALKPDTDETWALLHAALALERYADNVEETLDTLYQRRIGLPARP
jgi:hypothetical protein